MRMVSKIFVGIRVGLAVILAGLLAWILWMGANHCDSPLSIGNHFEERVTVYFEGKMVGKIDAGESRQFCLQGIFAENNPDLLIELKSGSGEPLFSKLYTQEEINHVREVVKGKPYWLGYGEPTFT